MSRRASLLAKEQRSRPKVRFPDELVFLDNIKEGDVPAMQSMLRRVSVSIDVNAIASNSGMTPLHSAVMEENMSAVRLLIRHGCDINRKDVDSWTPLHAACANGFSDVAKALLEGGADPNILTDDGERPYDLIEPNDLDTVGVMLSYRAMREGFNEEDEDEEEVEDDDDDREADEAEEHESEPEHVENESETENVENESETENVQNDSEAENVSCDEDSLEEEEKDNGSKQSISDSVNESKSKDNDENENNTDLPSPTPQILKSILKHSNKPRKALKFET